MLIGDELLMRVGWKKSVQVFLQEVLQGSRTAPRNFRSLPPVLVRIYHELIHLLIFFTHKQYFCEY